MENINSSSSNPAKEESGDELTYEQFLVYSARMGEIDDVKEMLAVSNPPVDINYKDDTMSMNTALHMASANGHVQITQLLL